VAREIWRGCSLAKSQRIPRIDPSHPPPRAKSPSIARARTPSPPEPPPATARFAGEGAGHPELEDERENRRKMEGGDDDGGQACRTDLEASTPERSAPAYTLDARLRARGEPGRRCSQPPETETAVRPQRMRGNGEGRLQVRHLTSTANQTSITMNDSNLQHKTNRGKQINRI
jgi:hypothetical protein